MIRVGTHHEDGTLLNPRLIGKDKLDKDDIPSFIDGRTPRP